MNFNYYYAMGAKNNFLKKLCVCALLSFFTSNLFAADIVINFCPVTKIQASKDWSATMQIQNNTAVVLDLANNKITANWPSLVALQWPFSNGVQSGTTWSFNIPRLARNFGRRGHSYQIRFGK
ncbi:MAG: hypothetical protein ACKOXB_13815 [Flavobacteriales bacterium]